MVRPKILLFLISVIPFCCIAQLPVTTTAGEMNFISDTQQPMLVEKIFLKPTHNTQATSLLFAQIVKTNPSNLYMLGDVVSLGYRDKRWKKVDMFLDNCRKENTRVYGLLGNHDVMGREKKGEKNFLKRFPDHVHTGYVSVTDSVAIILLNSNFNTLSSSDKTKQNDWYQSELNRLDTTDSVKAIIVTCHHAPYSNSTIVGSSSSVQQNFVPAFINSKKARLFITGHAHAFEHFRVKGKDFVVVGGGGGLHQPLNNSANKLPDLSLDYKPLFHYLSVKRVADQLSVTSHFLSTDFATFSEGHSFTTNQPIFSISEIDQNKGSKQSTF